MRYIIVFLMIFTFLFCDDDDHDKEHHHYYSKDLTYLDLTHDQKKSIKKFLKHYRKELKEYREYKEDIIDEKQKLFEQNSFDKDKLTNLNIKLAKEASKIEAELLENIHKVLTKEQRVLFRKYIDEWDIE